jgi:hypothetical protein
MAATSAVWSFSKLVRGMRVRFVRDAQASAPGMVAELGKGHATGGDGDVGGRMNLFSF